MDWKSFINYVRKRYLAEDIVSIVDNSPYPVQTVLEAPWDTLRHRPNIVALVAHMGTYRLYSIDLVDGQLEVSPEGGIHVL